jgi:heat shock protein 110kDa
VLSGNSEYDFNIDCLLEDNDFSYSMTRERFEQISEPALQRIGQFFNEINQRLTELGIKMDHIELLGGGSRIPCFIKNVSNSFGI